MNPIYSRFWIALYLCLALAIQSSTSLSLAEPTNAPITQPNLEKVTLQLKWTHQFQFAGYYAAKLQGYYRDEGLDVTLIEGVPSESAIKSVLTGKADYGITDSDILVERLKGKPLVAMASLFQHSPYVLMMRLDRGIYRPHDLIGRTVMVDDSQGDIQIRAILLSQGIKPSSVKMIPHSWNLDDLINRKVDAISAYYTVEPAQMRARGVEPGIMRAMDYGVDFYGDVLFTDEDEIARHSKRAASFLRASMKGWRYAFDHSEEMIQYILSLPGVQERGITPDALRFEADTMQHLVMPNLLEIGHMSQDRWERIARSYASAGLIPTHHDLDGFLYDASPPEVDMRILRWAAIAGICLLALATLASIWTLQLKQLVKRRTQELARQNEQLNLQSTALKISEESYRALFNIANDAIFVHDAITGSTLDVNERACELFGRSRTELIENDIGLISSGDEHFTDSDATRMKQRTLAEGPQLFEWHCRHKNGATFWCEINLKKGIINGQERIIALVRDITERKRAEEQRLKVSKMDALGIMAGGIAHDLNNIMLGIILNLDLLLSKSGQSSEDSNELHSAKNAALRASDLARRLLTFSKGGDPVKKMVDIKEIVLNALNLSLRGSNLLGKVQFEPNLPLVLADAGQLAQVIDNLVINAREACPRGGHLFVRGRRRHFKTDESSTLQPGNYLEIEIEDQGNGIPAAVLPKIFDPYFTTKPTGNGIGLTTCYSILKKHGGDITVRSEPGHGATFTLYMPIDTQSEPETVVPAVQSTKRQGRILIIDDDALIRQTLSQLLQVLHHEADSVESGEKGLVEYEKAMQEGHPFDIIILDGTIPGCLGGEAAFHALHKIDPAVQVILCSGYSDSGASTHWQQMGFCGLLPKPFSVQQLDAILQEVLAKK